jgi:membrane-associated phospholipid phosphatase
MCSDDWTPEIFSRAGQVYVEESSGVIVKRECSHRFRERIFGRVNCLGAVSCAVIMILLLLIANAAWAEQPTDGPYQVRWAIDIPITVASGAAWYGADHYQNQFVDKSCPCSSNSINRLDRGFAGRRSDSLSTASDILNYVVLVAPFGLDALDVYLSDGAWSGYLGDSMVMAETVAVNGFLNGAVKLGIPRPRPMIYGLECGDPELQNADNYESFYSSHTSSTFAAAMSYASTFAYRHPQSSYRYIVYGLAGGIGTVVGTLRVYSGRHFPTDVLAGAGEGIALGLLVPWLHARNSPFAVTFAPLPLGQMVLISVSLP